MKSKALTLVLLFYFLLPLTCRGEYPFRVIFYNVENLFDTKNSPDTEDDEFTPEGSKRWSKTRCSRKIDAIGKTISVAGEWAVPALVGLCEVETDSTLIHLTRWSPLREMDYRYILAETEDSRGIRTALLYQRSQFKYVDHQSIRVDLSDKSGKNTRHLLHVEGMVSSRDTLDVFVCHYPSRRDGRKESEGDRLEVSRVLREKCDSLFSVRTNPLILIMGDFNDNPADKSLVEGLALSPPLPHPESDRLYNPFSDWQEKHRTGSYKYRGEWFLFDQIIVSGRLLECMQGYGVYSPDFLLTTDDKEGGKRPYSTYWGYKYTGGVSDHLPVWGEFESF